MEHSKIRPSSLPKLSQCGQYEGSKTASDAANRGTRLDELFRSAWGTGDFPVGTSREDGDVVEWALAQMSRINGVWAPIETDEKLCKVRIPGMEAGGTCDAICVERQWHADLKSGQIYDYEAQMAAYAMGLMNMHGQDRWTAYLLFCDQKKVVKHEFTYESAMMIVARALANVGQPPTPNAYCDWCAKSLTCKPRLDAQEQALATTQETFLTILANPAKLGEFLDKCRIFASFEEAAKNRARELLKAGFEVPGWRLQDPRITKTIGVDVLAAFASELGPIDIIRAQGPLSLKKAEALWQKAGKELPACAVTLKFAEPALVKEKA
jgi:hypothetical protein